MVSLVCAAGVVIVAGAVGVGPTGDSVVAGVKTFLLDWETKDYAGAAAMTTGNRAVVASMLSSTYRELGAEDLTLAMGPLPRDQDSVQPITVRGDTAQVVFSASIDLGRGGLSWQYEGHFTMRRGASGWRVVWSPSVIVPGLGEGDRLAVVTTVPARAPLLDSGGRSLISPSPVVEVGVVPGQIASPARTAGELAAATGLPLANADEMASQIEAWPPRSFLELVQLSPASYARLRRVLHRVPGLRYRTVTRRLFDSSVPAVTGQIGTEIAKVLIRNGQPYRPGATVGLSGLEQAYQPQLAGTSTTEVVVQSPSGRQLRVLKRWQGRAGTPLRTTIDSRVQQAAQRAVAGTGSSAVIVAVRAGSGQILAVARGTATGMPTIRPLSGQYQPGQAFTVISTAALLASGSVGTASPVGCHLRNRVGGQTFTNVPAVPLAPKSTLASDFARACSTGFVGPSLYLSGSDLSKVVGQFGIGAPWRLPLPAFTGHLSSPGSQGELAADVIGGGTVQVSPLDMALAVGAVAAGTWAPPSLVSGASGTGSTPRVTLNADVVSQLRTLMLAAVRSGAARQARLPGAALYGQVGVAPLPGHRGLHTIWFVGFRGNVAFAVVTVARSASFRPAVLAARQFAASLPAS